jgi:hypothetical protein
VIRQFVPYANPEWPGDGVTLLVPETLADEAELSAMVEEGIMDATQSIGQQRAAAQ